MRRTVATLQEREDGDGASGLVSVADPLRTEFEFELPRGYVDRDGTVHRIGTMRLATARDELVPLHDDRVRENPAYLTVVLLARVVTRLGALDDDAMHVGVIEGLFASDLAFLQDLYRRINQEGHTHAAVSCPSCGTEFAVDLAGGRLGEIMTYAPDTLYEDVAYVAYHFHWDLDAILDLEHPERRRYVDQIDRLNALHSGGR